MEEVKWNINSLANDKSLGCDGLPINFYNTNIDWISSDWLALYEDSFIRGFSGRNINKGMIKLIPKNGDKYEIKNWRPITLLNISYKIIGKLLAKRIEDFIDRFILVRQTGFINGRYILENLIII